MITHDVEQGTPEWFQLRLGIPTASNMNQIILPPDYRERFDCGNPNCEVRHTAEKAAAKCKGGTGKPRRHMDMTVKPSQTFDATVNTLVAERLAGKPFGGFESEWMLRGKEVEDEARTYYSLQYGEAERVGFVTNDAGDVGCSPDAMGLEIKCPSPHVHISYLMGQRCPLTYYPQVQACIWICELDSWDFMSYHPDLPAFVIKVPRDEEYIAGMAEHVRLLNQEVSDRLAFIKRTIH